MTDPTAIRLAIEERRADYGGRHATDRDQTKRAAPGAARNEVVSRSAERASTRR